MNPPVRVDPAELEKLCRIGATQPEMAAWFGCSLSCLESHLKDDPGLREVMEKGYATFNISLRRKQAQLAEGGHATMLIWLGKQRLGQRDNIDTVLTGAGPNGEIEVNATVTARELVLRGISSIAERKRALESAGEPDRIAV